MLVTVFLCVEVYSQLPQDTCLKLLYPNDPDYGYVNRDSILVNSCNQSATYGDKYVYRYFSLAFETVAKDGYPFQSKIEYGETVDFSNFVQSYDSVKSRVQDLPNEYKFTLFRGGAINGEMPAFRQDDNEHMIRPFFLIKFDDYVHLNTATEKIKSIFAEFIKENSVSYMIRANITSINEPKQELKISIYPNPVKSKLSIIGLTNQCNYSIYSLLGTKIIDGNTSGEIDLSNLREGFYFIKIFENGLVANFTFIKE